MAAPGELVHALSSPSAATRLRDLDARGLLTPLFPELEEGRGFRQPDLHHYDVLGHNLAAVAALDEALHGSGAADLRRALTWLDIDRELEGEIDGLPLLALTRLAALLHDVGKPRTATTVDGRLRFPRHGPVGAEVTAFRLGCLGFGPAATDFAARLVRQHLRPAELVRNYPPSERAVRRFIGAVDGHVLPLMLLNLADGWATRGPGYTDAHFSRHCSFLGYVVARCLGVGAEERPG